MSGFLAASQHNKPRKCRDFDVASARSINPSLPLWALRGHRSSCSISLAVDLGHLRGRPIPAFHRQVKMLRSQPALRSFAAIAKPQRKRTYSLRDGTVVHSWIMNDRFQSLTIEGDYSAATASCVSPNPRGTVKSGKLAARFCKARPITTRLISVVPSTIRSIWASRERRSKP